MRISENQINLLLATNVLLLATVIFFVFRGLPAKAHQEFTEISAERINILGTEGKPVMVLSNRRYIPGPSMNGKEYPRDIIEGREFYSGILFFSDAGNEVGSLMHTNIPKEDGYWAGGQITFDQYEQNQVVALQYLDNSEVIRAGLRVWDRPSDVSIDKQLDQMLAYRSNTGNKVVQDSILKEMREAVQRGERGKERLFVGSHDQTAQIQLRDRDGRLKAKLYVDTLDVARLQFFNDEGIVVKEYSPIPD